MFTTKIPEPTQQLMALLGSSVPPQTYLAGGTALCLHLDHRPSFDLDLYTPNHFDEKKYIQLWRGSLPGFEVIYTSDQTIGGKVTDGEVSLFYFEYPLLEPPVTFNGLTIASITDIAAMKIEAISGRGLKRDFFDLYTICQHTHHPLSYYLKLAIKKFSFQNSYLPHVLKSLTYFTDAETKPERANIVDDQWIKVKAFFEAESIELIKEFL